MNYIAFKSLFKDFTIFSLNDIKSVDPGFHRRRLNDWQEKGYIAKVLKQYYIFSDLQLNENILFEIANRIYAPSYISLEMAFSYYGLIPEAVHGITSVTTRVTRVFTTHVGRFGYRTIKPKLYFGYTIETYGANKRFNIASPEKAILDYFYLNPSLKEEKDYESLRFNKDSFSRHVTESTLFGYLERFSQNSLTRRLERFWDFMSHA